jgi:C1A family cysteine protease
MRRPLIPLLALLLALTAVPPTNLPAGAKAPLPPGTYLLAAGAQVQDTDHHLPLPGSLPPEGEAARARSALQAVLDKAVQQGLLRAGTALVDVAVEREWARGQAAGGGSPLLLLAHRLPSGAWQALLPSSDGLYSQWVEALPTTLATGAEMHAHAAGCRPPMPSEPSAVQGSMPALEEPTWPEPRTWTPGPTSVSELNPEERARLLGVPDEVLAWEQQVALRHTADPEATYRYPASLDWRDVGGQDWTTPIGDQARCGSCVAFGTNAAIESRLEIAAGNANLNPNLSESHLFYCGCGFCCNTGWHPENAMDYAQHTGVVDEACFPYADSNQLCSPCSDWRNRVTKIESWSGTSSTSEMKQALADHGPIEVTMVVYSDFFDYTGGVYRYTYGSREGGHAITLVGYNDSEGYWIVKNSWGTSWGEAGWFRIAYGQCDIDDYAYIPVVTGAGPQVQLFSAANYQGDVVFRGGSGFSNAPAADSHSLQIPSGWSARTWRGDNRSGEERCWSQSVPDLAAHDWQAAIQSIEVYNYDECPTTCQPGAGQAALYASPNYQGACVTLDAGDYPTPAQWGGLGDDNTESVRLGDGTEVLLCELENYGGRCETLAANDPNLADNYIGANTVSSARVLQPDTAPPTGRITAPAADAVVRTCPLTIEAQAGDEHSQVARVEFHAYYDGSWHHLGDDGEAPYTRDWDCTAIPDQHVWLAIDVWDTAGNEAEEAGGQVRITLDRKPTPPTLLRPCGSATLPPDTATTLEWDASRGAAQYQVHLWGGAVDDTSAWLSSTSWAAGILAAGSYQWQARARNSYGESAWSAPCTFTVAPSSAVGPLLVDGIQVDDDFLGDSRGNGNGQAECGETIELYVRLRNHGTSAATGVHATLSSASSYVTWPSNTSSSYPNISAGSTGHNNDDFDLVIARGTPHGHSIPFTVQVSAENGGPWSDAFALPVSCPGPDLEPYTPQGYPFPVTPSSVQGTKGVGTLVAGVPTYLDWFVANTGSQDVLDTFYVELWVDETRIMRYAHGSLFHNWYSGYNDWPAIIDEPGWHTLRLVVDADDDVAEMDETDNVWERDFFWESGCHDPYEPNDDPAHATPLSYGESKAGDICPPGDQDLFQFSGEAGDRILVDIDAQVDGSDLDSYLALLDRDGLRVLAENDDDGSSLDSKLAFQLPREGTYYLRVRDYDHGHQGGAGYTYTLHLLRGDSDPPQAAITSPLDNAWLHPAQQQITASATDDGSGVRSVEFLWHDADWQGSDWVWLGTDDDGRDGWAIDLSTAGLSEQRGAALYIWAYDAAGNWSGAGVWNLGLDRTPPMVSARTLPMYGDAPFLDFWVDWWGCHDNLSGLDTFDLQMRDGATGNWTPLLAATAETSHRFVGQDGHTYYFRVRGRDQAGNCSTYATGDGDDQYTVQVCEVEPDAYEADNSPASAQPIATDGTPQTHNFHAEGDADWVHFEARAGQHYVLATANIGGHADTVLSLVDQDGSTLLGSDDNSGEAWLTSRLEWRAPASGTYYAQVVHADAWAYGCTTEYLLSVQEVEGPTLERVYLPIVLRRR